MRVAAKDHVALTGVTRGLHHKEINLVTLAWRLRNQPGNISRFQRDRVFGPRGPGYTLTTRQTDVQSLSAAVFGSTPSPAPQRTSQRQAGSGGTGALVNWSN